MDSQTTALLRECDAGCKMAADSMSQVLRSASSQSLGAVIADYKGKHEKLREKISRMLAEAGSAEKEPPAAASAFSRITTEMKLMLHEDSRQIAKIMMDGCNMGIQSISQKLNEYPEASPDSRAAAKDLIRMEEDFMKEMKRFL